MTDHTTDAVAPDLAGWWVAHLFYKITGHAERGPVELALKAFAADGRQIVTVAMLGHRADLGIVAIGSSAEAIRHLQTELRRAGLDLADSYLSRTELSEYAAGLPPEMANARLRPTLPPAGMPAFCFYPMSKRRGEEKNWFALPYEQRDELMREHGKSGRDFKGRVIQVVTGSTGLDDWEWGVTLFGVRPDDLKDCVYTMRFDEASARYAEFGPFYTGYISTPADVLAHCHVA